MSSEELCVERYIAVCNVMSNAKIYDYMSFSLMHACS